MKSFRFFWLIVALMFVISFIALPFLPSEMATHWGPSGEADDYSSKWFGAFIGPGILLLTGFLLQAAPKMDPRRDNYAKFQGSYALIVNATAVLLLAVHVSMLAAGFGYDVQMDLIMPLFVGGLFIVIGNYLPRIRPSYMVGIRTPWTLADDDVWRKTHRTGGFLFVAGGILLMLSAFLPAEWKVIVFIAVIAIIVVVPFVQSYQLSRR